MSQESQTSLERKAVDRLLAAVDFEAIAQREHDS